MDVSGSTKFGNVTTDTHQMTGSLGINWGGSYLDASKANFYSKRNNGFYIRSYYNGGIGASYNPLTGASVGGGRLSLASHDYKFYFGGFNRF